MYKFRIKNWGLRKNWGKELVKKTLLSLHQQPRHPSNSADNASPLAPTRHLTRLLGIRINQMRAAKHRGPQHVTEEFYVDNFNSQPCFTM